jgi:hypothetical protein
LRFPALMVPIDFWDQSAEMSQDAQPIAAEVPDDESGPGYFATAAR